MMDKEYHKAWHQKNKERCRELNKAWRLANPERVKAIEAKAYRKKKDGLLRKKYGISEAEYTKIYDSQNGLCAICKNPCTCGRNLAVDHDHLTGNVRALLCSRCNRGIGLFKESAEYMASALEYLKKHQKIA